MSDLVATQGVRLIVDAAAVVVLLRSLLRAPGARRASASLFQLAPYVEIGTVLLLAAHLVSLRTPAWYDAAVRPMGLAIQLAALVLVVWAYVRLGRYWDVAISALADHRVVEDGPFAIVRHPVYLGLVAFVLGGALATADPLTALAAFVMTVVVAFRARAEERFLEERLGDDYRAYARRVPMLLPWPRGPRRG